MEKEIMPNSYFNKIANPLLLLRTAFRLLQDEQAQVIRRGA